MSALYRKIAKALIEKIHDVDLHVGDKLPTESSLMNDYRASRNTVRESLRELETLGYIRRRRGTRAVVVKRGLNEKFINSVQSVHDLLRYPFHTISRFISSELIVADNALATRLASECGEKWQKVEILRLSIETQTPIGFSEIYVKEKYAHQMKKFDFEHPIYMQLEDATLCAFKTIRQNLTAGLANANVASRLDIALNSVVISTRTEFITADGDAPEIGFGHFRADRYSVESVLERHLDDGQEEVFLEQIDGE